MMNSAAHGPESLSALTWDGDQRVQRVGALAIVVMQRLPLTFFFTEGQSQSLSGSLPAALRMTRESVRLFPACWVCRVPQRIDRWRRAPRIGCPEREDRFNIEGQTVSDISIDAARQRSMKVNVLIANRGHGELNMGVRILFHGPSHRRYCGVVADYGDESSLEDAISGPLRHLADGLAFSFSTWQAAAMRRHSSSAQGGWPFCLFPAHLRHSSLVTGFATN